MLFYFSSSEDWTTFLNENERESCGGEYAYERYEDDEYEGKCNLWHLYD